MAVASARREGEGRREGAQEREKMAVRAGGTHHLL
jgi:hypothetical protein